MIPGRSGRPLRIRLQRPRSSEGARLPLITGPASPYVPLPSDDAIGREDEVEQLTAREIGSDPTHVDTGGQGGGGWCAGEGGDGGRRRGPGPPRQEPQPG